MTAVGAERAARRQHRAFRYLFPLLEAAGILLYNYGMLRRFLMLIPPALLIAAFVLLRGFSGIMEFAARKLGSVWRYALGAVTSVLPFSLMEIAGTALVLIFLPLLILLIVVLIRRRGVPGAVNRMTAYITAVLYGAGIFLWVWCSAYFAPPIYDGVIERRCVSAEELFETAKLFLEGANRLSGEVSRDAGGHFAEDLDALIEMSSGVFDTITGQFPALSSSSAKPKKMLYSEFMSKTNFTGIYFGLTGEANINKNAPLALIPSTIAHELAHSCGVGPEDTANFFGIAACITSGITAFEYSGYLEGLILVGNALYSADRELYYGLAEGYGEYLRIDLSDNSSYWAMYADEPAAAVMTAVYDGYLKANSQESGIKSYGECVDLLVVWILGE